MRYIVTFLSIFLLILSVNVFAQEAENVEITIDDIQTSETETQAPVSTIDLLSASEKANVFSCTNDYVGVNVSLAADYSEFVAGTTMKISGELQNDSSKTISNGTLYIKVLNVDGDEYDANIIDHFVVQENISIPANTSIPVSFDWNIPSTTPTSNYKIAAFLYIDNKFDIAGVSTSKVASGGSFDFAISGEETGAVYFDESTAKVNETAYDGFAPVIVQNSGDILVSVDADNYSGQDQNVQVKWKIYNGDSKNQDNLIQTINSDATIFTNSSENVTLQFSNNKFSSYYIVGELSYRDSKSIIEIPYVREGTNVVKIFSSGVLTYPVERGESNTISSCVYNAGSNKTIQDGKILVELKNSKGKVVETYEYKGPITAEVMGVKKDFKASKDLKSYSLHTSVWVGDVMVDESEVVYDCNVLNGGDCKTSILGDVLYPIAGFLLILVLLVVALKLHKNRNIPLALLILVTSILLFTSPTTIEAKSVTSSASITSQSSGGYPNYTFGNITLSADYTAEIRNAATNAVIADNASVPVGTQVRVTITTARPDWMASTPTWESGTGSWVSGAGVASAADACDGNYVDTYTNNYSSNAYSQTQSSSHTWRIYYNPTLNPTTKTITTSGNLSCGTFNGSGVATCNVTGTGALRITVNYPSTYGNFYRSVYNDYTNITNGVDGCTPGTWKFSPNPTTLPSRTIVFNLTGAPVVPPNAAPNAPVIGGSTTGYPSTTYTFSFDGTDPDGDQVRYGVDWDNNNTVDEYLPASGHVNSGTARNGTRSWSTTGTKTFKARTYDVAGLFSGWTTRTISIVTAPVNGNCGTTNNSCLAGTSVNQTDTSTNYLWQCNGTSGGTNESCSLPIPINGACGATNNSCTAGTLSDIADSGSNYLWRCMGVNGGTNATSCSQPIPPPAGPFSVSCTAPTVLPGSQATFTATPVNNSGAVTYQWQEANGTNISGATNSTFNRTYSSVGSYMLSVFATSSGNATSNYCYVTVGCNGTHSEGEKATACVANSEDVWTCGTSGWETVTQICTPDPEPSGDFGFNPNIVSDTGGTCRLELNAENVSSCRLIKNESTFTTSPSINSYLIGTSVIVNGTISVPIGRYTLECVGTGSTPVTRTLGVQSCIVNPDIKES